MPKIASKISEAVQAQIQAGEYPHCERHDRYLQTCNDCFAINRMIGREGFMPKITFLSEPNVRLSYTANDWQLYHMDGREDVAAQLNREIARRAAKAPTLNEFNRNNLLEPFDKWGADDTEGRYMLEDILREIYRAEPIAGEGANDVR